MKFCFIKQDYLYKLYEEFFLFTLIVILLINISFKYKLK
jgi:hypothetical protein